MAIVYKTHDPSGDVLLAGVVPVTGFAKGDYVSIAFTTPKNKTVMGATGDGQFVESKDKSGTMTVQVMSYSPANAAFTALLKSGVAFPIIYKKNGSLTVFSTGAAKVEGMPPVVGSDEAKMIEWKFVFISGESALTGASPL